MRSQFRVKRNIKILLISSSTQIQTLKEQEERLKEDIIAKHLQHQKELDSTKLMLNNKQNLLQEQFTAQLEELKAKSMTDVEQKEQGWHKLLQVS